MVIELSGAQVWSKIILSCTTLSSITIIYRTQLHKIFRQITLMSRQVELGKNMQLDVRARWEFIFKFSERQSGKQNNNTNANFVNSHSIRQEILLLKTVYLPHLTTFMKENFRILQNLQCYQNKVVVLIKIFF